MHRSGTSLITRWLNSCGLPIGVALHGPDVGNIDGHYEDLDFLQLHEQILVANQLSPIGLITQPVNHITDYFRGKMKGVIQLKCQHFAQWAWKDPRTCLFLSAYREYLPGAKYLVVIREASVVVDSLIRREFKNYENLLLFESIYPAKVYWSKFQKRKKLQEFYEKYTEDFYKVWLLYNRSILEHLEQIPRDDFIVVDYKMLQLCSEKVYSHLQHDWGFQLNYFDYNKIYNGKYITGKTEKAQHLSDASLFFQVNEVENQLRKFIL